MPLSPTTTPMPYLRSPASNPARDPWTRARWSPCEARTSRPRARASCASLAPSAPSRKAPLSTRLQWSALRLWPRCRRRSRCAWQRTACPSPNPTPSLRSTTHARAWRCSISAPRPRPSRRPPHPSPCSAQTLGHLCQWGSLCASSAPARPRPPPSWPRRRCSARHPPPQRRAWTPSTCASAPTAEPRGPAPCPLCTTTSHGSLRPRRRCPPSQTMAAQVRRSR
mmetsp:Transcript_14483/g.44108  ORF Transcript_14483/g.44108 Transcript_14483/m.44108 type:complete len:224 (+) Transcript_14483:427-1098(+)